jgi:hypothetical protein
MSTLLLHLCGNMTFNRTIFPPQFLIYDDILIYKKRKLFGVREMTISYNQISQVTLYKNLFFGHLEINTAGTGDIIVRFLPKAMATKAKRIIDNKVYHSHAKHQGSTQSDTAQVQRYEKSVSRLKELKEKGQINEREFSKKKKEFLTQLN